jgi:hypothetical protein
VPGNTIVDVCIALAHTSRFSSCDFVQEEQFKDAEIAEDALNPVSENRFSCYGCEN